MSIAVNIINGTSHKLNYDLSYIIDDKKINDALYNKLGDDELERLGIDEDDIMYYVDALYEYFKKQTPQKNNNEIGNDILNLINTDFNKIKQILKNADYATIVTNDFIKRIKAKLKQKIEEVKKIKNVDEDTAIKYLLAYIKHLYDDPYEDIDNQDFVIYMIENDDLDKDILATLKPIDKYSDYQRIENLKRI